MGKPAKFLVGLVGVAALAAAGWFGYEQLFDTSPAPAPTPMHLSKAKRQAAGPRLGTPAAMAAKSGTAAPETAAIGAEAKSATAAVDMPATSAAATKAAADLPAAPNATGKPSGETLVAKANLNGTSDAAKPGPELPAGAGEAAAAPVAPDKLIEDVLAASGMRDELNELPEQILESVRESSAAAPVALKALGNELERIVAESFKKENFQRRVRESLNAAYDEQHLRRLLTMLSTPALKKLIQLERVKSSNADKIAFVKSLASNPISPQRQALLERLDQASNSSGLGVELALASMRAVALGAAGNSPEAVAHLDSALERQRPALTTNIRRNTIIGAAMVYRNATDQELSEYIKLFESDHGKWFTSNVASAVIAEFKSAGTQVGEKIAALAKERAGSRTAKAQAKDGEKQPRKQAAAGEPATESSPPAAEEGATTQSQRAEHRVASRPADRAHAKDMRKCLEMTTTVDLIKCSEQGR